MPNLEIIITNVSEVRSQFTTLKKQYDRNRKIFNQCFGDACQAIEQKIQKFAKDKHHNGFQNKLSVLKRRRSSSMNKGISLQKASTLKFSVIDTQKLYNHNILTIKRELLTYDNYISELS